MSGKSERLENEPVPTGEEFVTVVGGRRNDTPTTRASANGEVAPLAVDQYGRLLLSTVAGAAAGAFAEDAAHVSGDVGIFVMGVNNVSGSNLVSNTGDYTPFAVNVAGAQYVAMNTGLYSTNEVSFGLLKNEDAASGDGHAGVAGLTVRQNTLASSTNADGDYQFIKSDSVGAMYTTPGTQAITPTTGSLAFGAVSGTYATLVTNATIGKMITGYNGLDTPIILSFNASTDALFVGIGAVFAFDLGANGRHVASNISVKSIGSPGAGTVYCSVLS